MAKILKSSLSKSSLEKVAIIGLGLIGASLLQGLHDAKFARHFAICDTNERVLAEAKRLGLAQSISTDMLDVLAGVDLVLIATPTKTVKNAFLAIKEAQARGLVEKDVMISDVASTKGSVLADAVDIFGAIPANFIPAHPIAGAEKSGFEHRNARLFCHHQVIICPHTAMNPQALQAVKHLWRTLGASISEMSADHHDRILAYTSHLPHLLAYNLTHQLTCHDDNLDIFRYAAGGFRDFSRIAASSPVMWHDIFLANKDAVLAAIDEYELFLQQFRALIAGEHSQELQALLSRAKHARTHFGHMLASRHSQESTMPISNHLSASQQFIVSPSPVIAGSVRVASDKSMSHRAIMLGSLADGTTHIRHFLDGEDALSTLNAFVQMGVAIKRDGAAVSIDGVGMDGLSAPVAPLYMGNSGTSMRLLAGILAAQRFDSVLLGDVSLSRRPMERVAIPLRHMGAKIQSTGIKGTPPLSITGQPAGQRLVGIDYVLPVASAQIKSALLLAGLFANGETSLLEPEISRDHSERMLQAFGYDVHINGRRVSLTGGSRLRACHIDVPADISSAAFFMVLAAIAQEGELTLTDVGINPTRTGVIHILQQMGADICLSNRRMFGGEPVADITVKASVLHGIDIDPALVPLAIDEFPVLFVAAACAIGKTRLTGAAELRVKESDRLQAMAVGLDALGIKTDLLADGIIINGKGHGGARTAIFSGGVIDACHDHRIAMSFSVAAARADSDIIITGTETVNTSFPNFAALARAVGLALVQA